MNPENPTPREQLEARLTALLLGELPADEADALRVEIAHYPELRSLCNRLQQTIELVRETACEPAPQADVPPAPLRLSEAKREQLLAQFKTVQPKEFAQPKRPTWLIQVAEISAAAAAILLVASLSVPNFVRSRTTSQANAVINNLRQLDGAKQQWALENKAPATAEPTMAQIQPYMGRGSGGTLPGPVMGETYMLGDLSTSPSAEIDASKKPGLLSRLFVAPPENGAGRKRLTLDEDRWRDVPQEQVSTLTTTPASGDASREAATRALDGIQPPQVIGAVVLPAPKTAKAAAVAPALAPAPVALAASPPRANIVLPSSGEQADDLTSREINVSAGGIAQNSLGMNAEVAARDRSVAGNRSAQDSFNLDSVKIPLQANNSFDNSDFSNGLARDDVGALRYSANKDDDGFFLYKPVQGDFSIVDQNRAGTTGTAGGRGGTVDTGFVFDSEPQSVRGTNSFVGRNAFVALPNSDLSVDSFTNRETINSANMDFAPAQQLAETSSATTAANSGDYMADVLKRSREHETAAINTSAPPAPVLSHRWSFNDYLTDSLGVREAVPNQPVVTAGGGGGYGGGGGGGIGGGLSDGSVQQISSSGFRGMGGGSNLVVFPGSTESDVEKVQPAQQQAQQSGGNFGSGVPAANALVPPATPLTSTNGIISRDPYLIAGTQPGVRFPIRSQPISIDNIDIQNFTNRGTTRDYPNATPLGSSQITYDPETHKLVVVTDDKTVDANQILTNLDRPKEVLVARTDGIDAYTPGAGIVSTKYAEPTDVADVLKRFAVTPSNTAGSSVKGVDWTGTLQQTVTIQRNRQTTEENNKTQASTLVQDGRALLEAGRPEEAESRLKEAIAKDPSNEAAYQYLRLVAEKQAGQTNRNELTSANAMVMVEDEWNVNKRTAMALPRPNSLSRTNAVSTSPEQQQKLAKLETDTNELRMNFRSVPPDSQRKYVEEQAKQAKASSVPGAQPDAPTGAGGIVAFANFAPQKPAEGGQDREPTQETRPYWEAKAELDRLRRLRDVLYLRSSQEEVGKQMPKTQMVEVIETASSEPAKKSSLLDSIKGAFTSDTAATARIKIQHDAPDKPGVEGDARIGTAYDPYFVQTQTDIIKSPAVLNPVIEQLKSDPDWAKKSSGMSADEARQKLAKSLQINPVRNTSLIDIKVKGDNQAEDAKIANAVAEEYKNYRLERETALLTNNMNAFANQLAKLETEIKSQAAKVNNLREKFNVTDLNPQQFAAGATLKPMTVTQLNGLKISALNDAAKEETQLTVLKTLHKEKLADALTRIVPDPVLSSLLQDRQRTEAKLTSLKATLGPNNPEVKQVELARADLNEKIDLQADGILAAMTTRLETLKAQGNAQRAAQPREQDKPVARKPAGPPPIPQPEVVTRENAFSTFSLNVSDVSFKLAGASLDQGRMPDPASIRSEEFINAFDYRDPEPPAGARVAFAWERARYPFAQNRDVLRFSIKTAALGRQRGRPMNIVLLLDKSGSMERADRVRIVQEALRVLAAQLGPQDRVSVVTFARTARLWVDGIPGNTAGEVLDQAGGLTPEGGTNLEDAMNLAYATALRHYLANGVNRVVLLTDGAANLGDVDPESLKQKVETHRKQGIALDCFGIGWEGFNDDLLEVLSRHGDGRYGFINTPEEAAEGFAAQLAGALRVAAADVKVQVEFNPKRVTAYRQIGYAKHQLTKEQFRDNTVDAAEIGAAEAGNALYTVEVNPAGEGPLATVRVRYKVPETGDFREQAWTVPCSGNAMALEDCGATIRLAATSSAFSEWLAQSPFAQEVTPDRLLTYLNGVPEIYGADARPKKLEAMIRQAKAISGK